MNVVFENIEIKEINNKKISDFETALTYDFKTKNDDLDLLLFNYEDIINFVEDTSKFIIEDLENKKLR